MAGLLLCIISTFAFFSAATGDSFAIFQDNQGAATLSLVNDAGIVIRNSSLHFSFPFPLVETTVDQNTRRIYIITFPKSVAGAQLYVLDEQLNVVSSSVSTTVEYFDLQYSTSQSAIYGIAVNGTYGRVLSNFTLGSNVTYKPLQALPYMWYVNASTYDSKGNQYFGLLNNFPRQPNSTTAQKLAVGNYSSSRGQTVFVDLYTSGAPIIVHFIAWSAPAQQLFGLAQLTDTVVAFVKIDPLTGHCVVVGLARDATTGPLLASPSRFELHAWLQSTSGGRIYGSFDLRMLEFGVLARYPDTTITAAAAAITW